LIYADVQGTDELRQTVDKLVSEWINAKIAVAAQDALVQLLTVRRRYVHIRSKPNGHGSEEMCALLAEFAHLAVSEDASVSMRGAGTHGKRGGLEYKDEKEDVDDFLDDDDVDDDDDDDDNDDDDDDRGPVKKAKPNEKKRSHRTRGPISDWRAQHSGHVAKASDRGTLHQLVDPNSMRTKVVKRGKDAPGVERPDPAEIKYTPLPDDVLVSVYKNEALGVAEPLDPFVREAAPTTVAPRAAAPAKSAGGTRHDLTKEASDEDDDEDNEYEPSEESGDDDDDDDDDDGEEDGGDDDEGDEDGSEDEDDDSGESDDDDDDAALLVRDNDRVVDAPRRPGSSKAPAGARHSVMREHEYIMAAAEKEKHIAPWDDDDTMSLDLDNHEDPPALRDTFAGHGTASVASPADAVRRTISRLFRWACKRDAFPAYLRLTDLCAPDDRDGGPGDHSGLFNGTLPREKKLSHLRRIDAGEYPRDNDLAVRADKLLGISPFLLQTVPHFTDLAELCLSGHALSPTVQIALSNVVVAGCPSLRRLQLAWCGLDENAEFGHARLEGLDLSDNPDLPLKVLRRNLEACTQLTSLRIGNMGALLNSENWVSWVFLKLINRDNAIEDLEIHNVPEINWQGLVHADAELRLTRLAFINIERFVRPRYIDAGTRSTTGRAWTKIVHENDVSDAVIRGTDVTDADGPIVPLTMRHFVADATELRELVLDNCGLSSQEVSLITADAAFRCRRLARLALARNAPLLKRYLVHNTDYLDRHNEAITNLAISDTDMTPYDIQSILRGVSHLEIVDCPEIVSEWMRFNREGIARVRSLAMPGSLPPPDVLKITDGTVADKSTMVELDLRGNTLHRTIPEDVDYDPEAIDRYLKPIESVIVFKLSDAGGDGRLMSVMRTMEQYVNLLVELDLSHCDLRQFSGKATDIVSIVESAYKRQPVPTWTTLRLRGCRLPPIDVISILRVFTLLISAKFPLNRSFGPHEDGDIVRENMRYEEMAKKVSERAARGNEMPLIPLTLVDLRDNDDDERVAHALCKLYRRRMYRTQTKVMTTMAVVAMTLVRNTAWNDLLYQKQSIEQIAEDDRQFHEQYRAEFAAVKAKAVQMDKEQIIKQVLNTKADGSRRYWVDAYEAKYSDELPRDAAGRVDVVEIKRRRARAELFDTFVADIAALATDKERRARVARARGGNRDILREAYEKVTGKSYDSPTSMAYLPTVVVSQRTGRTAVLFFRPEPAGTPNPSAIAQPPQKQTSVATKKAPPAPALQPMLVTVPGRARQATVFVAPTLAPVSASNNNNVDASLHMSSSSLSLAKQPTLAKWFPPARKSFYELKDDNDDDDDDDVEFVAPAALRGEIFKKTAHEAVVAAATQQVQEIQKPVAPPTTPGAVMTLTTKSGKRPVQLTAIANDVAQLTAGEEHLKKLRDETRGIVDSNNNSNNNNNNS
jgi:hypothetical protein